MKLTKDKIEEAEDFFRFAGEEQDIDEIMQLLVLEENACPIVILGDTGTGKSSVLLEIGRRVIEQSTARKCPLYLDAQNYADITPKAGVDRLLRHLQDDSFDNELLLLDNADQLGRLSAKINQEFFGKKFKRIIYAVRSYDASHFRYIEKRDLAYPTVVYLFRWSSNKSAAFVRSHLPALPDDEVAHILKSAGGIPSNLVRAINKKMVQSEIILP